MTRVVEQLWAPKMYALVSVKGGKFHRPDPLTQAKPFRATKMFCGVIADAQNYFMTCEDADRHTGGRLTMYACKHCERIKP